MDLANTKPQSHLHDCFVSCDDRVNQNLQLSNLYGVTLCSMAISLLPRPFISLRTTKIFSLPPRIFALRLSCSFSSDGSTGNPEKRSFSVATGDMFIHIASRLLKRSNQRSPPVDHGDMIGTVSEDVTEPGMIWEQSVKDVEADEKERRVITSPGFSFSAAGLLFPYHLGVAQLLIEKGYITVLLEFSMFIL